MNRIHMWLIVILVLCGSQLASLYRMTTNPMYTSCRFTTDAGATIHPRIEGSHFGSAIKGDYLVHGPNGEYIGVANVREKIYFVGVLLLVALVLTCFCNRKPKEGSESQNKNLDHIPKVE